MKTPPPLSAAARAYRDAGLCVLPAQPTRKRPTLPAWEPYQQHLPTAEEINDWFGRARALCVVCGGVSGNTEMIDFDAGAEKYSTWATLVEERSPGLLGRLYLESTQNGGVHAAYRCEAPVDGNLRLCQRLVDAPSDAEVEYRGKTYKPRRKRDSEGFEFTVTLIETRGEGGLFLCAPSPGYIATQGSLADLPVITRAEREILLNAAEELDELPDRPEPDPWPATAALGAGVLGTRPGDDFNARGDVGEVLRRHGWTLARRGPKNQYWVRPGKDHGHGATFNGACFYVFTSNAPPFEPDRGYSKFSVYVLLEHGGDPRAAARALVFAGFGAAAVNSTFRDTKEAMMDAASNPVLVAPPLVPRPSFVSVAELCARHRSERPFVIEGLLREGETMNVIAAPKGGKSWMAADIALSIAAGTPWLGRFATAPGEVLVIDNELHKETIASRFPLIASARGMDLVGLGGRVQVQALRGHLCDLLQMRSYFARIEPGRFKVIVLDAFYRFLPGGASENDNGAIAQIYNAIDSYADILGSAFITIHHTSKGVQAGKAVTDVGAGAGSQARAADAHLVLRPHEQEDCAVLDAAVRSWAPITPIGLRWTFPVWESDTTLDTTKLRRDRKSAPKTGGAPKPVPMTPEEFATQFASEVPEFKEVILERCARTIKSLRARTQLMGEAEAKGLIHRWKYGPAAKQKWSTIPQSPE